jgi:ABC-type multidrug transport system fused ATPase/permease subunit
MRHSRRVDATADGYAHDDDSSQTLCGPVRDSGHTQVCLPSARTDMRTFWRIIALTGDYKWLMAFGFIFAFAQMGLSLVVPRIVQLTIDKAIGAGDYGLLPVYGLALLGVGVARFGASVGRRLTTGKLSLGIEYDLRNSVWSHLLAQSFSYFDRWQTGQLMSRCMSDVQNVRMFLGYGLVFFTINVLQMVAVTVLLFALNWQLALLTLLFFPFLLVVTVRFGKRLQPVLKDVQQKIADVTTTAEENVTGSRIVRIFAREDDELEKFTERSTAVFEASVAAARLRALYIPLIGFLPNLAVLALLWYGGRQVIQGDLTLGELVAFYSYVMLLVYPAQVVGWLAGLMQRAIASGDRVFEILDAPLEMTESAEAVALDDVRGAVRFDHVSFAYVDHMVLDDVTLEVPSGRTVALVGHTGSGKSTLAALVPRFYDASGGAVHVDGVDVRDVKLTDLRRHIGIVDQDPFLFSTTIADNIRFGRPQASDEEVRAAARRAQADAFVTALPDGYETVVGERGLTLSGGQRQRIAIARALVMDPRILILDDATSSVDVETEYHIREALAEVMQGRTTFIIAHRPSTIALAEEVVVLDRGRIVERGSHEQLLAGDTRYARMFGTAEAAECCLDDIEFEGGDGDDAAPAAIAGGSAAARATEATGVQAAPAAPAPKRPYREPGVD